MSEFENLSSIPFSPHKQAYQDIHVEVQYRTMHAAEYIAAQLYAIRVALENIAHPD